MVSATLGDYAILVAIVVVAGGSYLLSRRMQPFWVSRDGLRFLTVSRELDHAGEPTGVRRDVHAGFSGDRLIVKVRAGVRNRRNEYRVTERRALDDSTWWYVLHPVDAPADVHALAARVPASSPLADRLDDLRAASDR